MVCSPISDRKTQKLIMEDIKSIKTLNRELSVSNLVLKIEEYYIDKNYSEDILFSRLSKLKTKFRFLDSIYGGSVGAFIGLMFSFLGVLVPFTKFESIIEFIRNFSLILFYLIIMVVVVSGALKVITKFSYRKKRMYDEYLNSKEIEIIEKLLEKVEELT